LERHQAALQQFAVALELNPQAAKIYYHLGGLYREMGRQTSMVQAWETFLRLAPNHAEAGKIRPLLEDYTKQEK
jgi:tetratricopeptide (TPR) repeat protein